MQKTIVEKGYTLEVTSWENDGDNYKTKKYTTNNLGEIKELVKLCKTLFISGNDGIGNTDEDEDVSDIILNYFEENPKLIEWYVNSNENVYKDDIDNISDQDIIDICMDYNHLLMGHSEYYQSRVFSSLVVYYSPEDINLDIIEF